MSRLALLVMPFLLCLIVIPAYAEVTSLQADRTLYAIDMNVYFTGTVDNTDSQKLVNLLIKDPDGKIVLMTGKFAALNDTFQITINTNDPNQFYIKGTYQATAFVSSASAGKTIFFDFSPNGSPVLHQTESQNSANSSKGIAGSNVLSQISGPSKYESVLHENMNIVDTDNTSKPITLITNVKQSSSGYDLENLLYPTMVACGSIMVGLIVYRKMKRSKIGSEQSKKSEQVMEDIDSHEDYALAVLKNRLAKGEITIEEFKTTKDVLDES
ncbi:MAG TPA: SHOCT domain-containing protein [Candidatus Nitrosotalea sp.]|nr:SHOCT domain-containing protein [Candidatus Nitrosotalea sp.]